MQLYNKQQACRIRGADTDNGQKYIGKTFAGNRVHLRCFVPACGKNQTSPLMDEAGFARKVEAAYRQMWIKWSEKRQ